MVRVGIIGAGFGAKGQLPGFRKAGLEVTAICARHPESARVAAQSQGVPFWTTDPHALVARPDVDLVAIATPPYLHRDHVAIALEAGKHVLCEKPFAMSVGDARDMLERAERAKVVHAIDHEFRYLAWRARLKELVDSDALGVITAVHAVDFNTQLANATTARPAWWWKREFGGGVLGATGSHWIDSLRWWFGEINEATGHAGAFVSEQPTSDGERTLVTGDDTVEILLRFASGAVGSLQLSGVAHHPYRQVSVFGRKGTAIVDEQQRLLFGAAGAQLEELVPPIGATRNPADGPQAWLVDAVAALAADVRQSIEDPTVRAAHPTFADGLRVQEVMESVYASARAGVAAAPHEGALRSA